MPLKVSVLFMNFLPSGSVSFEHTVWYCQSGGVSGRHLCIYN